MSATVTGSCVVSFPCSWESLLGEGLFSLNDLSLLLSHWSGHQNFNSPYVDLLFSLWCSSCDVVCILICWSASVTYVNLILWICRMDVNVSDFSLWSDMMRNFSAWMICSGIEVVSQGGINGYNCYLWNVYIVTYSWGGSNYPYVMTWNGLYMNHDDLSCSVCKNVIVTWKNFACPCPHGIVWGLTWNGGFCAVWLGGALLGFPKEVFCVDNPLQCKHTHHI